MLKVSVYSLYRYYKRITEEHSCWNAENSWESRFCQDHCSNDRAYKCMGKDLVSDQKQDQQAEWSLEGGWGWSQSKQHTTTSSIDIPPKGGGGIQNHCMSCTCVLQILYHFFDENDLYIIKIRHLYSVFIFQEIWHIPYHNFNFMNWIKCVRFSKEMKFSQYVQY